MTTDTTALQERIAEALAEHWGRKHSTLLTSGPCSGCSRVAADAVAAEVQAAKAEALRQAADLFDSSVGVQDLDNTLYFHGTPWLEASVQAAHENSGPLIDWLRARADEYETGDRA